MLDLIKSTITQVQLHPKAVLQFMKHGNEFLSSSSLSRRKTKLSNNLNNLLSFQLSTQYQYPFWTPDDSIAGSMLSIDDTIRKRSQSGSNEMRERLSAAAVRAKRAGTLKM